MDEYNFLIYLAYIVFFVIIITLAGKSYYDFFQAKTKLECLINNTNDQKE